MIPEKYNVMIIEDNPDISEDIRTFLALENYNVICAENGEKGLALLDQVKPDVILCDIMMPGIDGYEVLRRIRDMPSSVSDVPFVFLSARSAHKDIRQGMQLGAEDFLPKPFSSDELLAALKIQLSKRNKRLLAATSYKDTDCNGFTEKMKEAVRAGGGYLLCISPEKFHRIRMAFGKDAALEVLNALKLRLKETISDSEFPAVCRSGEGELIVLTQNQPDTDSPEPVIRRILAELNRPYTVNSEEIHILVCIGAVPFGAGMSVSADFQVLAENAALALETARETGKPFHIYSDADRTGSAGRISLESGLRHALERKEISLYLQPQYHLASALITGGESLMRWKTESGFISPVHFIPVAEETGLIRELGNWALMESCRMLSDLRSRNSDVRISVNVSPVQLHDPGFAECARKAVEHHGISPSLFEFEVTESGLIEKESNAVMNLQKIREMGARIALDDFGTGYSSLSYLNRFPIDRIKIDRSFIRFIGTGQMDTVVQTLIRMAHDLGCDVVAEGVENNEQKELLSLWKCDSIQGALISMPVPFEDWYKFNENFSESGK